MNLSATPNKMPSALLCDMDGTLLNTEPLWMQCEQDLVAAWGGQWTKADGKALVGSDLLQAAEIIRQRSPVRASAQQIVEQLTKNMCELLAQGLPWLPGAEDILRQARNAGIPTAVVTMSWKPLAEVFAQQMPKGTFTTIVSGDMVQEGKPHPEAYLLAAAKLDTPTVNCLALEDSPTGLRSAVAAQTAVVGIPNYLPLPAELGGARVDSLSNHSLTDLFALAKDSQQSLG